MNSAPTAKHERVVSLRNKGKFLGEFSDESRQRSEKVAFNLYRLGSQSLLSELVEEAVLLRNDFLKMTNVTIR